MVADDQGRGRWHWGDEFLRRSQELSGAVCPTGALWWARREKLLLQNTFYGAPFHLQKIDPNREVDIDDEEDLNLAELLVWGLTDKLGQSPLEMMKTSYFQGIPSCQTA